MERFRSTLKFSFFRGKSGIILAYDSTDPINDITTELREEYDNLNQNFHKSIVRNLKYCL